ncbi:MAG: DUF86 domain-containing protein [Candidatus Sumerlaeota bacterium]|nr:DUF86 domain-containing protein [Candidatus Sumerlaeota bacterium]
MTREYGDYLQDILSAIGETAEFTADMPYDVFLYDRKTANAVIRSLEVLGEAAKRIPEAIRAKAPDIPWKSMASMRDKLIHEYFGVDLRIVWTVVHEELPPLRPILERLLAEVETERDNP